MQNMPKESSSKLEALQEDNFRQEYDHEEKKKDSRIEAFVISVKKNYDPQNENDKLIIIQGFLDKNNRPISLDGKEAESRIVHTRTIDKKLLDILNGAETKMVKL